MVYSARTLGLVYRALVALLNVIVGCAIRQHINCVWKASKCSRGREEQESRWNRSLVT